MGRGNDQGHGLILHGEFCSRVQPLVNLSVAIGEAEPPGAVVAARGIINDINSCWRNSVIHGYREIPEIETVRMLVNKNIGLGMAHRIDIGEFSENAIFLLRNIAQPIISGIHRLAQA